MAVLFAWAQLDLFPHHESGSRGFQQVLAWPQLDLFTHGALAVGTRSSRYWEMSDRERDRRTSGQWLRAVKAYLDFGSGSAWRRLSDPEQRNSPERDWYLGGIRTMNGIPARDHHAQSAKAAAAPRVPSSPVARLMATRSRGWIVDELLRVNPALTDKKLLLRLSHAKLSEMLVAARGGVSSDAQPARKKQRRRILPKLPKRVLPVRSFPVPFPVPLRGAA